MKNPHTRVTILLIAAFLGTAMLLHGADDKNKDSSASVFADSLRGPVEITTEATPAPLKKFPKERQRISLQIIGQPPLIPHSIRGYDITANSNRCLTCHSWKNAEKFNAARVSISHFMDRNGKVLADVSPSRYFCTACHVAQVNAKPLIQNVFEPVESLAPKVQPKSVLPAHQPPTPREQP